MVLFTICFVAIWAWSAYGVVQYIGGDVDILRETNGFAFIIAANLQVALMGAINAGVWHSVHWTSWQARWRQARGTQATLADPGDTESWLASPEGSANATHSFTEHS